MFAQGARIGFGSQRDISDELLIVRLLVAGTRDDHGVTYGRMISELRFDFAKLDTKTAHLHLMIVTPQKLDIAVGTITREITRAIHARAGRERIIEKALGSEFGPIQIASRHTRAADIQLPHRAGRHQATLRIEQINMCVDNRLADDGLRQFGCDLRDGRVDGAFGRTIDIESADLFGPCKAMPRLLRDRFAANEQRQIGAPLFEQAGDEQNIELSRRAVEHIYAARIQEFDQR
ncbi:hypothetical protein AWB76_07857 [Caballeronia temeraria]|uniref:Uncharacterized protein n=1 Tax=Caballeronia temeraria TaxID=1777137 RepID=A0A158E1B6_9BURK|nr:hypothetical protein AWB76_07857 [Caballeronia temeraria]